VVAARRLLASPKQLRNHDREIEANCCRFNLRAWTSETRIMENWPERGHRHSVQLDASAKRSCGAELRTTVTDLSLDGCCLVGRFLIGDRVVINIPRIGSLVAELRWV